jgi:hypothetical protein
MIRSALIVAAVAALAVAGVIEGLRSNRWGESADVKEAAARLDNVPAAFGPWASTEVPMNPRVLQVAEAVGHCSRLYRHEKTGQEVSVLLLCGPSGPIASHTPDVCYAGNGYKVQRAELRRTLTLPTGAASYWTARFAKDLPGEPPLEVCWAWGLNGDWEAAENPRYRHDYVMSSYLYKLYATRITPADPSAADGDPVAEFLTAFLPEVKKSLAAPSAAAQ